MKKRMSQWLLIMSVAVLLAACAGSTHTTATIPQKTPTISVTATGTVASAGTLPTHRSTVDIEALINRIIAKMSPEEKVGQLQLVEHPATMTDEEYDFSEVTKLVKDLHIGGFIIYTYRHGTVGELQNVISQSQSMSTLPLMIATDQEGGDVDRLAVFDGGRPPASYFGYLNDPAKALAEGAHDGKRMLSLGFNTDMAPDVDVGDVNSTFLGSRLFGNTSQKVVSLAGAFLDGLQANGIVGTIKHFPGIGSLPLGVDPHLTLPTINRTLEQLNAVEFEPFRALIAHGPGMVMTTHVLIPSIDPNVPATLSPDFVTGILRNKLGYQGVIVTDQLHMQAITQHYSLGEAAVRALLAGNDILEGANFIEYAIQIRDALLAALKSGRITDARLNQSLQRIFRLKFAYMMGGQDGITKLETYAGAAATPNSFATAAIDTSRLVFNRREEA